MGGQDDDDPRRIPPSIRETLQSYASRSTFHGVSYIFAPDIPRVDQVVWAFFFCLFLVAAILSSISVFQEWQEKPVMSVLENIELPVTQLDFPAVTICTEVRWLEFDISV